MATVEKKTTPAATNITFEKCAVVLVDVLGTTTSINFAKETLFPFAIKNAEEILQEKWDSDSVKSAVKQLKDGDDDEINVEDAVKLLKELTEKSSDNAGLKALQGIIYEKGYESGELKAHVFADVPTSFESWSKSRKVAIYSTGSIESQKSLFANSVEGDLAQYITKYFDQSVGSKTDNESYKKIVKELDVKPEEVLFITDLFEEAKAAKEAGLSVAIVTREGNEKLSEDSKDYAVISSFNEIVFENSSKRKTIEEPVSEEPPAKVAKTETEKTEAMEVDATQPPETSNITEKKTESNKETEEKAAANITETDSKDITSETISKKKTDKEETTVEAEKKETTSECSKEDTSEQKVTAAEETKETVIENSVVEAEKESATKDTPATVAPKELDEVKETIEAEIVDKEAVKVVDAKTEESADAKTKDDKPSEETDVCKTDAVDAVKEQEDEKENKQDLANAFDSKEAKVDAAEKVNGDSKATEETNGKDEPQNETAEKSSPVEEVTVKKGETTTASNDVSAVTVEV